MWFIAHWNGGANSFTWESFKCLTCLLEHRNLSRKLLLPNEKWNFSQEVNLALGKAARNQHRLRGREKFPCCRVTTTTKLFPSRYALWAFGCNLNICEHVQLAHVCCSQQNSEIPRERSSSNKLINWWVCWGWSTMTSKTPENWKAKASLGRLIVTNEEDHVPMENNKTKAGREGGKTN